MDIVKILQSLKGKVLDASHFELLEHAYKLQEENIKQLKTNNEALKENNSLIADELNRLRAERESLNGELSHVKTLLPSEGVNLSEFAEHVLSIFEKNDAINMLESNLLEEGGLTTIQTQSGITELQEYGFVSYAIPKAGGNLYGLQPRGKERIAKQQKL
ncbi:hypothetical protein [Sessilibacter corallicola]|uniref:hypothetical protein n=1 Tax=Sessilibacter corallicola TaxID=2904075 RepID=UPI001E51AD1C|nr:hypothetical protein [Sessilibacter corallicola]MCE2030179.1 hypothetical protein [Sessilibacter corallicola]